MSASFNHIPEISFLGVISRNFIMTKIYGKGYFTEWGQFASSLNCTVTCDIYIYVIFKKEFHSHTFTS